MTEKYFMLGKYNKRIKRPLPEYDLEKPLGPFTLSEPVQQGTSLKLKSDKECCIIFPLYTAYNGVIPHYVINSAFWAAHSWRVNTDMIKNGWDIWFFVDRELWVSEVQQMFEKANLTDFVLLYDVPHGRAIRHRMGSDLYATTEPYFQSYYRVYMADTDLFPSTRDPQNIIKTEQILNIGEDESVFKSHNYSYDPTGYRKIAREKYETDIEEEARPIYVSFVEKYLGYKPTGRWGVAGQLFAWNPQQLREDFKEMVIELTPDISDDEEQYGFYLEKTGLRPDELHKLWDIPIYYQRADYFRKEVHYFDHIWLGRSQEDWDTNWKTWRQKMKEEEKSGESITTEVAPILAYDDPEIKHLWRENIGLYKRL